MKPVTRLNLALVKKAEDAAIDSADFFSTVTRTTTMLTLEILAPMKLGKVEKGNRSMAWFRALLTVGPSGFLSTGRKLQTVFCQLWTPISGHIDSTEAPKKQATPQHFRDSEWHITQRA